MFKDTTTSERFPRPSMTFTPNLPTSMRRIYGLAGVLAGISALALPSLEAFERGILGIVSLGLVVSAVAGYCCIRGLLGLRAARR